MTPYKKSLFCPEQDHCDESQIRDSAGVQQNFDFKESFGQSKLVSKGYTNEHKDENSLEDLKVSSSDVNGNSLLRPNNLDYDSDNKENSILNHPNVMRSIQSQASKQSRKTHDDDIESLKGQSKIKSSNFMQISQFLGSISKMDDGFAEKINQYMQ